MTAKSVALWIAQALLASMFLFAGGAKLVMTPEQMAAPGPIQLPVVFIRSIGVCEVLGASGMIVPWLTGIKPGLTPLAGAGLAIIMVGADGRQPRERSACASARDSRARAARRDRCAPASRNAQSMIDDLVRRARAY